MTISPKFKKYIAKEIIILFCCVGIVLIVYGYMLLVNWVVDLNEPKRQAEYDQITFKIDSVRRLYKKEVNYVTDTIVLKSLNDSTVGDVPIKSHKQSGILEAIKNGKAKKVSDIPKTRLAQVLNASTRMIDTSAVMYNKQNKLFEKLLNEEKKKISDNIYSWHGHRYASWDIEDVLRQTVIAIVAVAYILRYAFSLLLWAIKTIKT